MIRTITILAAEIARDPILRLIALVFLVVVYFLDVKP